MQEKGAKIGSNVLDIAFGDPGHLAKKTIFFHHIPKTAGTSFRFSMRQHFDSPTNIAFIRHIEQKIFDASNSVEKSADYINRYIRPFKENFGVLYIGSHFTAPLAWVSPETSMITLIRDPDKHYISLVNHRGRHFATVVRQRGIAAAISELYNFQSNSLLAGAYRLPKEEPSNPANDPYVQFLISEIQNRFRIYLTEKPEDVFLMMRSEYGIELLSAYEKRGKYKEHTRVVGLVSEAVKSGNFGDPLWFDRLLYRSVSQNRNT